MTHARKTPPQRARTDAEKRAALKIGAEVAAEFLNRGGVTAKSTTPGVGGALAKYNEAKRALAEAHRVDEVKEIRDKAVAVQAYAKQAKDTTLITQATEIRLRAERRAGELLREMEKNKGTRGQLQGDVPVGGSTPKPPTDTTPTLSDLGINKTQSSRWQQLAALDAEKFETKVAGATKRAYDNIAQRFIKEAEIARAKEHHGKIIEHGCVVEAPQDAPPSAAPVAPDYVTPKFDRLIEELAQLITRPAASFDSTRHSANTLKIVADFILAVCVQLQKRAASREELNEIED